MNLSRAILAIVLMTAGLTTRAELVDGIIVKVGGDTQEFAITDVREVTFADNGLTVIKTDDVAVEFSAGWEISFGEVENTGVQSVIMSTPDAKAWVYNVDGKLLTVTTMSQLDLGSLPKGIYIIKCNGTSLKVIR